MGSMESSLTVSVCALLAMMLQPRFTTSVQQETVPEGALQLRPAVEFKGRPVVALTAESLPRLLFQPARLNWSPGVAEKTRSGAEVYAKVAPRVVVVRTQDGHGS